MAFDACYNETNFKNGCVYHRLTSCAMTSTTLICARWMLTPLARCV